MKRILLALCACAALSARAELLLYDGFATATDAQNRTPYLSTKDSHPLDATGKNNAAEAWTTGLSKDDPWSASSAVVFTFPANGLSLPAAFAEGTGDQFSARGGSVGYQSNSDPDGNLRAKNRAIVSTMPTTGTLWYRCVMLMEQNAYNGFKTGTRYAGTGLSTRAWENSYSIGADLAAKGFRVYFQGDTTGGQHVKLMVSAGANTATLVESISANTAYVCVVGINYGTGRLCAYAETVADYRKDFDWTVEDLDASAITGSAFQTMYLDGAYKTATGRVRFDEIAAGTDLEDVAVAIRTQPKLKDGSLSFANGIYSVSASLTNSAATVSYVLSNGTTATTNAIAAFDNGDTVAGTFAAPTDDTTYEVLLVAENQGGETGELSLGTIYGGTLSLAKVSDANELGVVPATLTVSRANDDPFPLVVNVAFADGTGVAGQNYVDDAGSVTIPAGETSATIRVTPLVDVATAADTTMSVSLAAGNYTAPAAVAVTIANFTTPAGLNYWIGGTATDGAFLASTPANWSAGHAPLASESVIFDGNFSTANCEWDADATATVAAWTQTNGYTGTVTFDTEFPDYAGATFTLFTVTGNCDLRSGRWSCRGNYNNYGVAATMMATTKTGKRWCLNVSVGGAMTIAQGASVSVTGRGYGYASTYANRSQAYGGYAFAGATAPYGSIVEPFDPGMGCISQTDGNNKAKISGIGGGAVKLAVAGTLTLDGSIEAVGTIDQNVPRSGGTGGSIWIVANQIAGSGAIDASACPTSLFTSDTGVSIGSGGRIALYTQAPLAIPMANVSCSGTAYRGTSSLSKTRISGPGTIFVKDPTQAHGTLYVKQSRDVATTANKRTGTPVMGDLALDAVVLSGNAQLCIPAGTSLSLPSLSAVTTGNTTAGIAGIVCDGGTLDIGDGDQVLKANVAFASPTPFAFPGDLTLESGAHLGAVGGAFGQELADFDTNCTVSVAGDLTIPAGATAGASGCCSFTTTDTAKLGAHGGQALWASLGGYGTNAFDSVLNPSMPGSSRYRGFRAGGVFRLTVGGELALDGTISSDGTGSRGNTDTTDGQPAGAAGTINLSVGSLSGLGLITAQGGCGRYNYAGGAGGGRIAIRLTGSGAAFSDWWKTNVTACGVSFSGNNDKASSAGTVYLQDASDGEAAGTVLIRNDLALEAGAVNNRAVTLYPGTGDGCDAPDALRRTSLLVGGAARVQLTDSLRSVDLDLEAGTTLDLAGHEFAVTTAHIGQTNVKPGLYTVTQLQALGFAEVVDTADGAGGTLRVLGAGMVLIVK